MGGRTRIRTADSPDWKSGCSEPAELCARFAKSECKYNSSFVPAKQFDTLNLKIFAPHIHCAVAQQLCHMTTSSLSESQHYCWTCNTHYRLSECLFEPVDNDRLHQWICPRCEEVLHTRMAQEPDFSTLSPTLLGSDEVAHLHSLLRMEPGETQTDHHPAHFIHLATIPYHAFLSQFDWMNWQTGADLLRANDARLVQSMDFGAAMTLLFTLYRADRFNEGLLDSCSANGFLRLLVHHILSFVEVDPSGTNPTETS